MEQTLVLIKPDGVQKNLVGTIVDRFEKAGLSISAMKMAKASDELAKAHYPLDEEWAKFVFEKAKTTAEKENREFKYNDHMDMGKTIISQLIEYIKEGPIIAMVISGPHAIELVRKMLGHTEPKQAAPGTIRSDFASTESYEISDREQRSIRNLVHASDSKENAKREISVWFNENEIH